jgi:hypothetical protein
VGGSDFEDELSNALGAGGEWPGRPDAFESADRSVSDEIERSFGAAGWFSRNAEPFQPPEVPFAAPPSKSPDEVAAVRRLWLSRWNPADPDFDAPDIDDDGLFPWRAPEFAPNDGWWLSTKYTPKGRFSIESVHVGDLVVCQRTFPGKDWDPAGRWTCNMMIGLSVVGLVDAWGDTETGRRERAVCLVPLTKFDQPVPVAMAKRRRRLKRPSFSQPLQRPGRTGPLAYGLSAVEWEDVPEILSVCGVSPEVLAEPDTAKLAARLRATETGNPQLLGLRYDSVVRHQARRRNEEAAEERAEAWAASNGYALSQRFQTVPLAGFDLLVADAQGNTLQIEVKGYSTDKLAEVNLQPSQAWRAVDAAQGQPPKWVLFAVLQVDSTSPAEMVVEAEGVVRLLDTGGIKVKGGWPISRPDPRRR